MTTNKVWILYANDLKHYIHSMVKDKTITDDILQDTFLKIHTKLHTLKDTTKIKNWCFTIAKNAVIDYWKTTNKSFDITIPTIEDEYSENIHSEKDCLKGILKNLPEKYRAPLFLSDIKGLKQQEVANQLNQSLSTTKSQIQRARKLIAKGFMDCCGFVMNSNGVLVGEVKDKKDCKVCN